MKKTLILVLFLTFFICTANIAKGETMAMTKTKYTYEIDISLKTSKLDPPAVIYAIFNKDSLDPLEMFKENLTRGKCWYENKLKEYSKDKTEQKSLINVQVAVNWDRVFKGITGDRIYLLPYTKNNEDGNLYVVTIKGDGPKGEGTFYLATKTAYTKNGDLVFWYFPIKIKEGAKVKIVLNDSNCFNYKNLEEAKYIDFNLLKQ